MYIITWVLAAVALLLIVRKKEIAMGGEPAFRHFGATLGNACVVLAAVNAGLAAGAAWRRRWDVAFKVLAGLVVFGGALGIAYL